MGLTDVSPDPDLPFEKQIDVLSQIVEKTEDVSKITSDKIRRYYGEIYF